MSCFSLEIDLQELEALLDRLYEDMRYYEPTKRDREEIAALESLIANYKALLKEMDC